MRISRHVVIGVAMGLAANGAFAGGDALAVDANVDLADFQVGPAGDGGVVDVFAFSAYDVSDVGGDGFRLTPVGFRGVVGQDGHALSPVSADRLAWPVHRDDLGRAVDAVFRARSREALPTPRSNLVTAGLFNGDRAEPERLSA